MVGFTNRKYDSSRLQAIADAAHYTTMLEVISKKIIADQYKYPEAFDLWVSNMKTIYMAAAEARTYRKFQIRKIIVNGPATIVFWDDNTKTVVKCSDNDTNDIYNAVASALAKKMYGSNSRFKKVIERAMQ